MSRTVVDVDLGDRSYPVVIGAGVRHELAAVVPARARRVAVVTQGQVPFDVDPAVEHRLFEMHLKHRMRAVQGAFHANPDYSLWYGWSEMQRDLTEIRELAAQLRRQSDE